MGIGYGVALERAPASEENRMTVATFNWRSRAFVDVFTKARSRSPGK